MKGCPSSEILIKVKKNFEDKQPSLLESPNWPNDTKLFTNVHVRNKFLYRLMFLAMPGAYPRVEHSLG
jgi:hypothetical protein